MDRKSIVLFVLLLIGAAAVIGIIRSGTDDGNTDKHVAVGLYAPSFEIVEPGSGKVLSSTDVKGKVIFVNFWASWCQPCKDEMPSIDALHREFAGNKDFRMLTVLYRDDLSNALGYMKSNGYAFPVYIDLKGTASENFGVTGVPETYIIGKEGILKKRVIGPYEWNSVEAHELVASLLKE